MLVKINKHPPMKHLPRHTASWIGSDIIHASLKTLWQAYT